MHFTGLVSKTRNKTITKRLFSKHQTPLLMQKLYRKERIKMFLNDYYFGYKRWITLLRLIGGPLIILIGVDLYLKGNNKIAVAYSGFCVLFGMYMIFKPFLWILFRLDNYKTENINIKVTKESITINDNINESKIAFDTFVNIRNRKYYYLFLISKTQRLRLPKKLFNSEEEKILEKIIKTHYNSRS